MGKPLPEDHTESLLQRVAEEFSKFEGGKVHKNHMTVIAKVHSHVALMPRCLVLYLTLCLIMVLLLMEIRVHGSNTKLVTSSTKVGVLEKV